jgi:hypothetical protein
VDENWGSRRPSGLDTGIGQVLEIYATRGGRLEGARKWPQNPLTLTHVRWMSEYGDLVEAFCPPEESASVAEEERKVWVELALDFSSMHPNPAGMSTGWMPLPIGQERAVTLSQRIPWRGYSGARMGSSYGSEYPTNGFSPLGGPPRGDPFGPQSGPTGFGSGQIPPSRPQRPPVFTPPPFPTPPGGGFEGYSDEMAPNSGGYQQANPTGPDISVFPCVEIELPSSIMGPTVDEYTRTFANDVARNFNHAVRTIVQARETRGWMRGGRLVLAARLAMGRGTRAPGQFELDSAVQLLRDALARYTLTYSTIGHADLGAWSQQGRPLPD